MLIHVRVRYLEHYDFRLVREALIERDRLISAAPHLIRPMAFVLPHVDSIRPWWLVRAGLYLYDALAWGTRSEEHTSELQSLMRISYAVFCLKKKNTRQRT